MKKIALAVVLIASICEASQTEYRLIETMVSSHNIVLEPIRTSTKTPKRHRRSPLDALNGRLRSSSDIEPTSDRQRMTAVRHRDPLNALRGDNTNYTKKAIITKKQVVRLKISKKPNKSKQTANLTAKKITLKPIHVAALVTSKRKTSRIKTARDIKKHTVRKKYTASTTKTMYLTFDDGPLKGTENVLRVLKEENIDATMFFVGLHVQRNKRVFNKALSMPNILVANHTYTHANDKYEKFYNNKELVLSDVDKAQKLIGGAKYLRLCGRNVWRLPAVNRDDFAIRSTQRYRETADYDALESKGYQIYGWDTEWSFDHSSKLPLWSAEEMANKIEVKYSKGYTSKSGKMILLAHDYMFQEEEGAYRLKELISILKSRGWKFAAIDEYTKKTPEVFVKLQKKKIQLPKKKLKADIQFPKEQIKHIFPKQVNRKNSKISILATRLNDAIRSSQTSLVRSVIRKGADVNALDSNGNISLNMAVRTNNIYIVKTLIRQGARVNNRDARGASPILIAKRYNRLAIGTYLINQLNMEKSKANPKLALKETVK